MSTVTITTNQTTHKPHTFSFAVAHLPLILNLPAELVIAIIELVASENSPATLATTCKDISKAVDAILYHTVILDSHKTIDLFYRTTLSRSRGFFAEYVKKLFVTCRLGQYTSCISNIITACTALRALVSPSCVAIRMAMQTPESYDSLSEITFQSYGGGDATNPVPHLLKLSKTLTHLRFCEPSDGWYSPSSMLSTFGPLPYLSYLQFSRRANANEDNDLAFTEDIRSLLRSRPALKIVVVSIFPSYTWNNSPSGIQDSHIWKLMRSIQDEDQRVIIMNGIYGEWRYLGGCDQKALWRGWRPTDFWATTNW